MAKREFWRIIKRRRIGRYSLYALVLLYGLMLFAEPLAPYDPNTVFKEHSYHPPNLTFYSKTHGFGPQVQRRYLVDQLNWKYVRIRGEYERVGLFTRGVPYKLWGVIPMRWHLFGTRTQYIATTPHLTYPVYLMGADHLGRDLFTRILYGSRISLTIGFFGITISLFLAILLGGLAGYYGGPVDWGIMRFAEFISLIPGLYLILFLRSVLSRTLDSGQSFVIITAILSLVGWPASARVIRGLIHSLKREDFVISARLQGIPTITILFRQMIPQLSSIIIISMTLGIPGFILTETVLSYLGLGIVDPAVSWGSLINRDITSLNNLRSFPWFLFPALFLLIVTLAYSFLGDVLRDALDPNWHEKA